MSSISQDEKLRRQRVNASVVGTNAMEGLELDPETLALMGRFELGELTREELSAAIDLHVAEMLIARNARSEALATADAA
jgi:hypothetical protein